MATKMEDKKLVDLKTEDMTKKGFSGFMGFIREQGVVGLSVGFILGGAVSGLSKSLVNDIISPLLSVLLGDLENLESAVLEIGEAQITWGSFVTNMIDFVVIAGVVYFVVKGLRLDKLDKKKPKK